MFLQLFDKDLTHHQDELSKPHYNLITGIYMCVYVPSVDRQAFTSITPHLLLSHHISLAAQTVNN